MAPKFDFFVGRAKKRISQHSIGEFLSKKRLFTSHRVVVCSCAVVVVSPSGKIILIPRLPRILTRTPPPSPACCGRRSAPAAPSGSPSAFVAAFS